MVSFVDRIDQCLTFHLKIRLAILCPHSSSSIYYFLVGSLITYCFCLSFDLIFFSAKELSPLPKYIDDRNAIWEKCKTEYAAFLEAQPKTPIKVTLPDGKQIDATAWQSTPYDVAKGISQGLADNTVIAKVNGELWDLDRVLEKDCKLQLLKFDDPEAQAVFWHSSAHIMGEAMERIYGGLLCYGPPIECGFYYDMFIDGEGVSTQYCN